MKNPVTYMMASQENGTIYTGATSNLVKRAYEHREGLIPGFTKNHSCKLLVWYEQHETMEAAIAHEKQLKGGSRKKKLRLVNLMNPEWQDLFEDICK